MAQTVTDDLFNRLVRAEQKAYKQRPVVTIPKYDLHIGTPLIGPVLYTMQQTTDVSWGSGTPDLNKIATADASGETVIYWSESYHCSSPVWGTDFERIVYQEANINVFGNPSPTTTKLCTINKDGTGRIVIHDSGGIWTGSNWAYYYNYCMSPDGQKVALITPYPTQELRCVWADGSGDCGGGVLSTTPYGNPQWSSDSQTVYISTNTYGIHAFNFQNSPAGGSAIYSPNDLDYFWISNAHERFASAWNPGRAIIINKNGTIEHSYTSSDFPWPYSRTPLNAFWTPDDNYLIVDQQDRTTNSNFSTTGHAVKMKWDDPTNWIKYLWPPEASQIGIINWGLATVGGVTKLLGACHSYDTIVSSGAGIYQWDLNTGAQEGFLIESPWSDPIAPVWNRYTVSGLATCTGYFGAQVWDI